MSGSELNPATVILVCSNCLTASCWLGEFYCEDWRKARLAYMTVRELQRLGREHPDAWARSVRT